MFKIIIWTIKLAILFMFIMGGLYLYSSFACPKDEDKKLGQPDSEKDLLIDMLAAGNISSVLGIKGFNQRFDSEEIKEKVRDRIKGMLDEEKDALTSDWQNRIQNIIGEVIDEIDKSKAGAENDPNELNEKNGLKEEEIYPWEEKNGEEELESDKITDNLSGMRCKSGYIWEPKAEVGCVQIDCREIVNADWNYFGICVCGEPNQDKDLENKNKECYQEINYKSCPRCVYACVSANEDCPDQ
ncbi:hypothetical protein K8R32_02305 [bacterium]|nr:hypothetical protein [bacterium]